MVASRGGRGKKADYETIQVRCPKPIKPEVQELIRQFHAGEDVVAKTANSPRAMSDEEIMISMGELGKELLSRLPKSTERQAEEICDRIIREMENYNLSQNEKEQFIAHLVERCFS
jgi:vacuolar-type H+-ATPase subunit H